MVRRLIVPALILLMGGGALATQAEVGGALPAFEAGLAGYVEMHRRLEGPLPPLMVTADMDEVHRLMDALRQRIRTERKNQRQGWLLPPPMVALLRARVQSCLTNEEIARTMESIDEHTPPNMPPLRVNQALPEDAPFGMIPSAALRTLPPLPPELRYVVLSKALVIWDHHADLVVDLAPGVFDARTYRRPAS
ncbi:MAG TPA: hypothetical protein VJ813_20010 [Vicinamibacterales bacterium]|nr:hypothetical protein [Vicinamibacterales bacterium]